MICNFMCIIVILREILNGTFIVLAFPNDTQKVFGFSLVHVHYSNVLRHTPPVNRC